MKLFMKSHTVLLVGKNADLLKNGLAEFLVRRIENIETGEEKRGYSSVFTIFHHPIEVIAGSTRHCRRCSKCRATEERIEGSSIETVSRIHGAHRW